MNPVKKLVSWWRGPTDLDTIEAKRLQEASRQTIRISQNATAKQTGSSLLSAPTPDLLEPGREHSHKLR